jgi:CRP-like cAMP-binding protein
MEDIIRALQTSVLCKNMSEDQIIAFIKTSNIMKRQYSKGSIVFHETDKPAKFYLLMEGKISLCKDTLSGRKIVITDISDHGDIFGEVYLYMQKKQYGIYSIVQEKTQLLEFNSDLFDMEKGKTEMSHIIVLQNLLMLLAQKAYNMNTKLQVLSSGNLRQCLIRMILNMQEGKRQITLEASREEMAHYLNVARQSVSRELSAMEKDGLIQVSGKHILILDQERMEEFL